MKRHNLVVFLAFVGMAAAALPAAGQSQLRQITIGTNPAGTNYFVLGGAFAGLFQEKIGIRSSPQPYSGSSVYLPLLNSGGVTMGVNASLDTAIAYAGRAPYPHSLKDIRVLARIWILPYAYFVRAKSNIASIGALKGKRVVVTLKTNVELATLNRTILATGGVSPGDVTDVVAGGIPQNITDVVEGRADAGISAIGIPLLHKAAAGIPGGIRVLPVGRLGTDAFMAARSPGASTTEIKPSPRNVGVSEPMRVAAFDTYLNISGKVSDADAYELVKVLHDNWKALQEANPPLRGTTLDMFAPPNSAAPYHPGAVKFYKQIGLWTAANERHQQALLNSR
jgi:uncharacterized protein